MSGSNEPFEFPDAVPLFLIGRLVRHRRYGYRGVVVDFDMRCMADDQWYYSNQTHPDRDQPWYHVLVHDSTAVTYAAETSLIADDSDDEINHPLIEQLFDSFDAARKQYERNDTQWPALWK